MNAIQGDLQKMLITPFFRSIHDPFVAGIPPGDPHRDFMKMPSGELRFYGGRASRNAAGQTVLIRLVAKSMDCGLNWQTEELST